MITIELDEHSAEDYKAIEDLRSMGVPDEYIQRWYDRHKNK